MHLSSTKLNIQRSYHKCLRQKKIEVQKVKVKVKSLSCV